MGAPGQLYCWKCGLQQDDSNITCAQCGAANAPGQGSATPPTVHSPKARELEIEHTRTHQRGRHVPGAVSMGIVLVIFVAVGAVLNLLFGH